MDSPPQDQRTGSPNMLDLDHLVQKVQDVQDIRGKMQQLQEERKKDEALQESSQQSELDPTKSEVQKLQTHIQQLEDNMKEMAEKRIQLLNECTDCLDQCQSQWISRLKEWKWEQQKAVIGHPFDDDLDPLQSWCERLFEVNKNLREELKLVGEPMSELQDRLEKLLKVLVQSSLVVDKQPPQDIEILSSFSTTVRCLLGEKVMTVVLKVKIINEVQARDLDSGPSDDAGELFNDTTILKSDTTKKSTCATFLNMYIMNIKRPDIQGSKPMAEQKFALLFSTEIFIPGCDAPYRIQIISLPMVIMNNYFQRSSAQTTILWDCAFSEADRVPFMVPEQVPWSTMFKTLNRKFTAEVQTQHNLDQHNQHCLAEKIFNKPDCADDFSNTMVSWAQFNEVVLPGQWFPFWKWCEGVMKLTKTHLRSYWSEGTEDERPVGSVKMQDRAQDAFELLSVQSEGESQGDGDSGVEMEASVTAVKSSVTNNQSTHPHLQLSSSDPGWSERDSSCLSRSHSVPSLSQTTSAENKTFPRSQSLPDMLKCEEFTPDISVDEDDETYRFQCSCPGLYQCSVTGLLFHMEGEGDVLYRTVPWDRRLLAQHHKRPAGPLFDIKCVQQSVCQLHLPHCEIRSTGGGGFLSVAHVTDEGIQFIVPHKITETHVVINITGFSAFGNVKDEPDPVRALVLLFYRPPADPDPESLLNVLMLPVNIVLQDVLRTRKTLVGDEIYIETISNCKLRPKQEYTLSTCPEDDSVLVQPKEAEFDCDNYDNYFPSFQVKLKTIRRNINLVLRATDSSSTVWEGEVDLLSTGVKRTCKQGSSSERLLDIRSSFIDGISGPDLKSLLDKLLEKEVITGPERESVDKIQNYRDKACFVIDTVRKKGEAASSEMMEFLFEVDPFLCEHMFSSCNTEGEPKIQSIPPFTKRDLELRSLGDPTEAQTSQYGISVPPYPGINKLSWPQSDDDISGTICLEGNRSRIQEEYEKASSTVPSSIDLHDDMLDQPPPVTLTETIKNQSPAADATAGFSQDNTREMDLQQTAGPSTLQLSTSDDAFYDRTKERDDVHIDDHMLHLPTRKDTDDGGPSFEDSSSTFSRPSCSQSTAPTVCGPPCPQDRPVVLQDSDMLKSSCEEFTPDISVDEDDETYRFQCSCPGLYQCSVTGLLFHMEGEGDVLYRTVPWDRRLLAQHHKRPAGPLFDIKCVQQSVCQLHLPHCEIRSTGGGGFLSVAHVTDEGIQFIVPHKITETHVVINITGFSGLGVSKDEDSPPDPVQARVLLFYRPPSDPDSDLRSFLNVLLLPRNILLQDVLRTRREAVGDEIYIETSPDCELRPNQEYTLSTCPEDDSVLVQPKEAKFYCDNYDNYFPSFQVILKKIMKDIKLFLRETNKQRNNYNNYFPSFRVILEKIMKHIRLLFRDEHSVWEREVCLSSNGVKRSCGPSALSLPPNDRLLDIRSSFIHGISGPVLKSLLDKLLEKGVLTDSERETADAIQNHRDKARSVIDTVRKKGEAASSEMIKILGEIDPMSCENILG